MAWQLPSAQEYASGNHPFDTEYGDRYVVIGELGRGGMGRVLSAEDRRLRRIVAIKEISATEHSAAEERLAQEAWITGQLDHPNIVSVYDAGRNATGRLFYVMHLVRGKTLAEVIMACRTPGDRIALLRHFLAACQAVAYAHSTGIIHRDLKPSNILVGEFGETQVMDWGLARPIDDAQDREWSTIVPRSFAAETVEGTTVGTPRYMSPEQASGGNVDCRADVWSLGIVLHEVVTGALPFEGDTPQAILEKIATQPPKLTPSTPPELAAIITRALSRAPRDRYATAGELAEDIACFLDGQPVKVYAYSSMERVQRFMGQWKLSIGAALLIVLVAVGVLLLAWQDMKTSRQAAIEARVRSDSALQMALITQALAALKADARAEAEILAANALKLGPSAEARGVLAGFAGSPRPQLVGSQPAPICNQEYLSNDGAQLLCLQDDAMSMWSGWPMQKRWDTSLTASNTHTILSADGRRTLMQLGDEVWLVDNDSGELMILPKSEFYMGPYYAESLSPRWAGTYHTGRALLIDLDGEDEPLEFTCDHEVTGMAISSDEHVALLCARQGVVVHDLNSDEPPRVFEAHLTNGLQGAWTMSFSPDGSKVVIGSLKGWAEMFDLEAGRTINIIQLGNGMLRGLKILSDNRTVMMAPEIGKVTLWDTDHPDRLKTLPGNISMFRQVADGLIMTLDDQIRLWKMPTQAVEWKLDVFAGVSAMSFSPDSQHLLVGTGSTVESWSLRDQRMTQVWKPDTRRSDLIVTKDVAYSQDGSELFISNMSVRGVLRKTSDGAIHIPDSPFGPMRRIGMLGEDWVWGLSWNKSPILWNRRTGQESLRLTTANQEMFEGESSFNGLFSVLLSVTGDVYRLQAEPTPSIERIAHQTAASAVDISEDGSRIILASKSRIWMLDAETKAEVWSIPLQFKQPCDLALSADGEFIAVGYRSGFSEVWSVSEQRLLATLRGHSERVFSVAFSPDGQFLATGSWDDSVRLWRLSVLFEDPTTLIQQRETDWGMNIEDALSSEIW